MAVVVASLVAVAVALVVAVAVVMAMAVARVRVRAVTSAMKVAVVAVGREMAAAVVVVVAVVVEVEVEVAVAGGVPLFRQVLQEWGHTCKWEGLKLSGEGDDETGAWLRKAIEDNTLEAVTDGSYMKDLYPNMNSCAFILECSRGRGRISGAFLEQTMAACSY